MNLLNKKLIDKLKILDDIDKQYKLNIKIQKNKELNGNNKDIKNNNDNSRKENFNRIYSCFFDEKNFSYYDGNKHMQNYYISNNNNDKEPTNENSIEKEKNESFSQKGFVKANSIEKNITNNDIVKEENINYEIDIGERLNNYGNYIKRKIENERERQYYKIKQRMKPEILPRSKSIKKNSKKLDDIFEQHYKKKISNNKNKKNKIGNISINKSNSPKFNQNSTFSYHPKLNKKSLLIAQKFEPSFIRLNQKKKINIEIKPETYNGNLYEKSSKSYRNNNKNNLSFSGGKIKRKEESKNIYEKMNNLYLRGVEQRRKKEKNIKDNQKKKQEEYKKYTFKPKLNKNISFNKYKNNKNIYNKNFEWKKKIDNEIKKRKAKKEEFENKLCTFKPQLCQTKYHNNDKLNYRVLDQMNNYIAKRKDKIKYKNSEEKYKNKKLGIDHEGYVAKSTIPIEFDLKTEKRSKDFSKNKNKSCDNFHRNKINKIIEQNSEKKFLNNETEKKYWFFKDNINSNNKINEPQMQINFVEAVNLLHDKLDKLNI